jgi:hypothetical protein
MKKPDDMKKQLLTKEQPITKEQPMSQATKKPANLRANVMPTDGYVLSVDGKLKTQFETAEEAMTAASKLKQSYPVIQVSVLDAAMRKYTPVELQEEQEEQVEK